MSKPIFNRNAEQVKKDAINLSKEEFAEKYSETSATELVLFSVWKSYNQAKTREKEMMKMVDKSTELVEVTPIISNDKNQNPDSLSLAIKVKDKETGKVKKVHAELADGNLKESLLDEKGGVKRGTVVVDEDGSTEVIADKPGRTPRMRELIKDSKYGMDKKKVKAQLIAEGFNTEGSGFHSEWNRVSKSIK
jgi:hypothetical protein